MACTFVVAPGSAVPSGVGSALRRSRRYSDTSLTPVCRGARLRRARMQEGESTVGSTAPIPSSLRDACEQAIAATRGALSAGIRRVFVEIDTSNGDATYTLLKNTLPVARSVLDTFPAGASTVVLFPDSGAAALARKDWAAAGPPLSEAVRLRGIEDADIDTSSDAAVVVVAPRASEVKYLESVMEASGDLPVMVVNPDLVDMGVTGLSLNARRLRENYIDLFLYVYYLKVFPWGVLLRAHPGKWGVWVDDPDSPSGFRLVVELEERPTADDIQQLLDKSGNVDASANPVGALWQKLSRFLSVYSKG